MRKSRHTHNDQERFQGTYVARDDTPWYLYTQWVDHRSKIPAKGGWKAFAYAFDSLSRYAKYETHVCYTAYLALEEVKAAIEADVKEETR